jgi:hypothetical protein
MTLLINENSPTKNELIANILTGGIAALPDFGKGDALVPVTLRTVARVNGAWADTWQAGDVLTIGIGDGIDAPVCVATITTALPSASVTATNVSYSAGPPATLATSTISFTAGTYGGLYSVTATANSVTTPCGNISPIATPSQFLALLQTNPQITASNCTVTQIGATFVVQWTGNLAGTSPTIAVTNVSLLAPVGASGALGINTSGIAALFAGTTANQLSLVFEVSRTRGSVVQNLYQETVTILRSVIDPNNIVPTPPLQIIPDFLVMQGTGLHVNIAAGITGGNRIAAQSAIAVADNSTNYVEVTSAGVAAVNQSAFNAANLQLAIVVTSGGAITSITDSRGWVTGGGGGGGTITAGTTPTSGYTAGQVVGSDGTNATAVTLGTAATDSNVTSDGGGNMQAATIALSGSFSSDSGKFISDGGGDIALSGSMSAASGSFVVDIYGNITSVQSITSYGSIATTGNITAGNLTGTNTGDQTSFALSGITGLGTGVATALGNSVNGSHGLLQLDISGAATITDSSFTCKAGTGSAYVQITNSLLVIRDTTGSLLTSLGINASQSPDVTEFFLPITSGNLIGSGDTGSVTPTMLSGSIPASKLTGTDIATVGTITTGTWNGSIVTGTYGGTGVNNGGNTLTYGGNTTISGGGTISLGGFTLTVPATGTAALLATSNTFTGTTNTFNNGITGNKYTSADSSTMYFQFRYNSNSDAVLAYGSQYWGFSSSNGIYSYNGTSKWGLGNGATGTLNITDGTANNSSGKIACAGVTNSGATTLGGTLTTNGAFISTPQALSGAGAVSLTTLITELTATAPAHAVTLANGTSGQVKIVKMVATSGGGTCVITPTTAAGYTTITISAVGQQVILVYSTTGGWSATGNAVIA